MTRKIVLLTGNHVCHNPRAFKEANTFSAAGYDVEWLGAWFDPELASRDRLLLKDRSWRFTPVTDWSSGTLSSRVKRLQQRARRWLGLRIHKFLGRENSWQLGYCTRELLRAAEKRDADLFIAHSEPALWAADQLRGHGRRVGVDMEDWFSEDSLPQEQRQRPLKLLRWLEKDFLLRSSHATCTSEALSSALVKAYSCKPPLVVYNTFPLADRESLDGNTKDRRDTSVPSLHWFSQTLGPGRGLEDLFGALPLLALDCEVHLRGNLGSRSQQWLNSIIPLPWKKRVFVHPIVHNDELLLRIAEHDIGLALDPKYPPSRDLTITNKILQYLLAGLAVIASDTAGHLEVAEHAKGAVDLYRTGDPQDLARTLNALLGVQADLESAKRAALAAAEEKFCWEKEAPKLVAAIKAALQS